VKHTLTRWASRCTCKYVITDVSTQGRGKIYYTCWYRDRTKRFSIIYPGKWSFDWHQQSLQLSASSSSSLPAIAWIKKFQWHHRSLHIHLLHLIIELVNYTNLPDSARFLYNGGNLQICCSWTLNALNVWSGCNCWFQTERLSEQWLR